FPCGSPCARRPSDRALSLRPSDRHPKRMTALDALLSVRALLDALASRASVIAQRLTDGRMRMEVFDPLESPRACLVIDPEVELVRRPGTAVLAVQAVRAEELAIELGIRALADRDDLGRRRPVRLDGQTQQLRQILQEAYPVDLFGPAVGCRRG